MKDPRLVNIAPNMTISNEVILSNQLNSEDDPFAEYMWMEHEEEFNRQVRRAPTPADARVKGEFHPELLTAEGKTRTNSDTKSTNKTTKKAQTKLDENIYSHVQKSGQLASWGAVYFTKDSTLKTV